VSLEPLPKPKEEDAKYKPRGRRSRRYREEIKILREDVGDMVIEHTNTSGKSKKIQIPDAVLNDVIRALIERRSIHLVC
jgi:hypothetical protein